MTIFLLALFLLALGGIGNGIFAFCPFLIHSNLMPNAMSNAKSAAKTEAEYKRKNRDNNLNLSLLSQSMIATISMALLIIASLLLLFVAFSHLHDPLILELANIVDSSPLILSLNGLSSLFLIPVALLSACLACYLHTAPRQSEIFPVHLSFIFFFIIACILVLTANNILLFCFAWQVIILTAFFLNLNTFSEYGSTLKWLILAQILSLPIFVVCCLLWNNLGVSDFSIMFTTGRNLSYYFRNFLFILVLISFAPSLGILHLPFLPKPSSAPGHILAMLSNCLPCLCLYGMIKAIFILAPLDSWFYAHVFLILALLSSIFASFKALTKHNLRESLAWYAHARAALMLLALALAFFGVNANLPMMVTSATMTLLLLLLTQVASQSLLFFNAGVVVQATGTDHLDYLGGLFKKMPLCGISFLVGSLALLGLPPFGLFFANFSLFFALLQGLAMPSPVMRLIILLILTCLIWLFVLSLPFLLKMSALIFFGQARSPFSQHIHQPRRISLMPLLILPVICLGSGLFLPLIFDQLLPLALQISKKFLGQAGEYFPDILTQSFAILRYYLGRMTILAWILPMLLALYLALYLTLLRGRIQKVSNWLYGCQFVSPRLQYSTSIFTNSLFKIPQIFLTKKNKVKIQQKTKWQLYLQYLYKWRGVLTILAVCLIFLWQGLGR